jgi:uncharacterized protein YecE (DUF72 family)
MGEPVIHLGTSAFTAAGWPGSFHPESLRPADYLSYYATQFDTVELDNASYRTPSESTVRGWNARRLPALSKEWWRLVGWVGNPDQLREVLD